MSRSAQSGWVTLGQERANRASRPHRNTLLTRLLAFQVLQELSGDPALEKFRKEYEKLHRALRKSHGTLRVVPALEHRARKLLAARSINLRRPGSKRCLTRRPIFEPNRREREAPDQEVPRAQQ